VLSCDVLKVFDASLYSLELCHLLAECFRSFIPAKKLERIVLTYSLGRSWYSDWNSVTPILMALQLADFSRRIIQFPLELSVMRQPDSERMFQFPSMYLEHIQEITISDHDTSKAQFDDDYGLGYRRRCLDPVSSEPREIIAAWRHIEVLDIRDCNLKLSSRHCIGCDSLFTQYYIAPRLEHLIGLQLCYLYISGGRLRHFIKVHSDTLIEVEFENFCLTDGTWRCIAGSFLKILNLCTLVLNTLIQKHPASLPQYL
jgi:hypothetical protein